MCGLAGFSGGVAADTTMLHEETKREIVEALRVVDSVIERASWKTDVDLDGDRIQMAADLADVDRYTVEHVLEEAKRFILTDALGSGIDRRGGDAIGVATMAATGNVTTRRALGTWEKADASFIDYCTTPDIVLMHARFATCGDKHDVKQAHPYTIKRNGRVVLVGAHNGVIYDARESAKRNNRPYTVDSLEVFELLADGDYEAIGRLHGYGVLTWMVPGHRHVNLVRLSDSSDIEIAKLKTGGIVWASTWRIIEDAVSAAGLEVDHTYKIDEIGQVYKIYENDVRYSTDSRLIKLAAGYGSSYGSYGTYGSWTNWESDTSDEDWREQWKKYLAENYGEEAVTTFDDATDDEEEKPEHNLLNYAR